MPPLVARGQVFRDLEYTYPDGGNIADKYVIVLNKNHLPTQPIIVVPVATYRGEEKFSAGCKTSQEYHQPAKNDFFPNDTKIQLFVLGLTAHIPEDVFKAHQQSGRISKTPVGVLRQQTMSLIVRCIKQMEQDVRQDYSPLIF